MTNSLNSWINFKYVVNRFSNLFIDYKVRRAAEVVYWYFSLWRGSGKGRSCVDQNKSHKLSMSFVFVFQKHWCCYRWCCRSWRRQYLSYKRREKPPILTRKDTCLPNQKWHLSLFWKTNKLLSDVGWEWKSMSYSHQRRLGRTRYRCDERCTLPLLCRWNHSTWTTAPWGRSATHRDCVNLNITTRLEQSKTLSTPSNSNNKSCNNMIPLGIK